MPATMVQPKIADLPDTNRWDAKSAEGRRYDCVLLTWFRSGHL